MNSPRIILNLCHFQEEPCSGPFGSVHWVALPTLSTDRCMFATVLVIRAKADSQKDVFLML